MTDSFFLRANGRLVSAFVGSDALGNSFRFSGEVGEQRKGWFFHLIVNKICSSP